MGLHVGAQLFMQSDISVAIGSATIADVRIIFIAQIEDTDDPDRRPLGVSQRFQAGDEIHQAIEQVGRRAAA